MGFLTQLRILLWKNTLLRFRNRFRIIAEIIFPLLLFVVLVIIRAQGYRIHKSTCHFDERAMPSAGLIPFAQSFFCTINNTCFDHDQRSFDFAQNYDESDLYKMMDVFNEYLGKNMNESRQQSLQRAVTDLFNLRNTWGTLKSKIDSNKPLQGISVSNLSWVINDTSKFQTEIFTWAFQNGITWNDLKVLPKIIGSGISLESINPEEILQVVADPKQQLCDPLVAEKIFSFSKRNISTSDLEDFLVPLCNISSSGQRQLLRIIFGNLNAEGVQNEIDKLFGSLGGKPLHWSDWSKMLELSLDLRRDLIKTEPFRKLAGSVDVLYGNLSDILKSFINRADIASIEKSQSDPNSGILSADTKEAYVKMQKFFCGRNIPLENVDSLLGDKGKRFDALKDRFRVSKQPESAAYTYDNSTTKGCNKIMEQLESNVVTKIIWNTIKPFIRGKILFFPDAPITRKIITKLNETFAPINSLRLISLNWLSQADRIKSALFDPDNMQFIQETFLSRDSGNLLDRIFKDPLFRTLNETGKEPLLVEDEVRGRLDSYFNSTYNETWSSAFDAINATMYFLSQITECFDFERFVGTSSEYELELKGEALIANNTFWAGIVFTNIPSDGKMTTLPPYVQYKIRMDSNVIDSTSFVEDFISRPGPRGRIETDLKYFVSGFAMLQDTIEHQMIELMTGRNTSVLPGVFLQQFPYPCYINDQFTMIVSRTFPMLMVTAWVFGFGMIVKAIVYEKEKRLKETMKVMGLGNAVHWAAWFIDSFTVMISAIFFLTILLKVGNVLVFSNATLVFAFMTCFAISTISLAFLLSVFFSKANMAAAAAGITFFCLYLPYVLLVAWESKLNYQMKIAASLISNVAFGFGCNYLSSYEQEGTGANWANMWTSPQTNADLYSFAGCMGMMLLDALLYGILTWYLEAVFPGEFGVPKPWYFFVTTSYWFGYNRHESDGNNLSESDMELGSNMVDPRNLEQEPRGLHLGVSIKHLHKIYPNGKVAIEELNVNFYDGQITSFLGHNGAGKTTTISILTGIFPPTSGTAKINGLDIRTSMDEIRKSIGLCPQHNVLFDDLTVYEHLWFYARLKGLDEKFINDESTKMIEDLGLPHKRDSKSSSLSGGMQRKLSIASAFVGGSRVVILDEPTAGVDPYSRRSIWDLLTKYKPGRTIIMSTHFMDEADLLGDRIAIINSGKLVCVGSSLFLRSRFGNGYYLTLVRDDGLSRDNEKSSDRPKRKQSISSKRTESDQSTTGEDENVQSMIGSIDGDLLDASSKKSEIQDQLGLSTATVNQDPPIEDLDIMIDDEGISDVANQNGFVINPSKAHEQAFTYPVTKFVTKFVPNARLLDHFGSELVYILPHTGASHDNLERLFTALDQHMEKLQIGSYGLSDTTLEEIFLKVASNIDDGTGQRQITCDDVTDHGRYAARTRSASARSTDIRSIYAPHEKFPMKVLGMFDNHGGDNNRGFDNKASNTEKAKPRVKRNFPPPNAEPSSQALFFKHMMALEVKRFHYSRRDIKGVFCGVLLPLAFVCLAMIATLIIPDLDYEPPLELHPWIYPTRNPNDSSVTFLANRDPKSEWPNMYLKQVLSKNSFGARCLDTGKIPRLRPCMETLQNHSHFMHTVNSSEVSLLECSCTSGAMICPENANGIEPPQIKAASHDTVINLSSRNISDFILKTTHKYHKKIYGGFEFGVGNPWTDLDFKRIESFIYGILNSTKVVENLAPISPSLVAQLVSSQLEEQVHRSGKFDNIRVWFNNKGWAASMGYMNAANNLILRASLQNPEDEFEMQFDKSGSVDQSKYGISVINHPMNYSLGGRQSQQRSFVQASVGFLNAIFVIFGLSFVPASFVVVLIEERMTKLKHLQFVSSVNPIIYWLAAFLWDIILYSATAMLCIPIFYIFDARPYIVPDNLPAVIFLLILFGWACVPLMYPFSFVFENPSTAFISLSVVNLMIGIITLMIVFVLENLGEAELNASKILTNVFTLFPQFCFGRSLVQLSIEQTFVDGGEKVGMEFVVKNRFEFDSLGKYMLALLGHGIFNFMLTLALEFRILSRLKTYLLGFVQNTNSINGCVNNDEDHDVGNERRRIVDGKGLEDLLVLRNLCKVYPGAKKAAVNKLTFGVKKGECFGLLGVNGAGKTTTFKMMTGDTEPTSGTAFVNGYNIRTEMSSAQRNIGYCPQFDALNPLLTGREHLILFGRLRGLSENAVKKYTEWGLKRLGLMPYADRCAGTYSGGNKRKLSTAIALLGNPSVIFLDEPTTGMDPGARRLLWNQILEMIRGGQSVVLTSHSMEECEALCTKLAIMVNGQFECLGSIQHLKNRYGSGYTLTARCESAAAKDHVQLQDYVEANIPNVKLQEGHISQLQWHLPLNTTKLSHIFHVMENARKREELGLEDYSISQLTLDEVFIQFANRQSESDVEPDKKKTRFSLAKSIFR